MYVREEAHSKFRQYFKWPKPLAKEEGLSSHWRLMDSLRREGVPVEESTRERLAKLAEPDHGNIHPVDEDSSDLSAKAHVPGKSP